MVPKKLVRLSKPLAQAIAKGAHLKESSQQKFMCDAIENALIDLGDDTITSLVSAHQVLEEEREKKRGTYGEDEQ